MSRGRPLVMCWAPSISTKYHVEAIGIDPAKGDGSAAGRRHRRARSRPRRRCPNGSPLTGRLRLLPAVDDANHADRTIVVFRCCTVRSVRTARCRACSSWRGCRRRAGVLSSALAMDKAKAKRCSRSTAYRKSRRRGHSPRGQFGRTRFDSPSRPSDYRRSSSRRIRLRPSASARQRRSPTCARRSISSSSYDEWIVVEEAIEGPRDRIRGWATCNRCVIAG